MIIGLSGGGARSFAHIGFMQAALEVGIVPTGYSGTSGGAIIATLLANGWSIQEIKNWALNTRFDRLIKWSKLAILTRLGFPEGLMSNKGLGEEFARLQKRGLIRPVSRLWINATNTPNFDERIFGKDDFEALGYAPIIQATTAIPGIIAPVEIEGVQYSDGGVSANPCYPPGVSEPLLVFHLGYAAQGQDPKGWLSNVTSAIEALQWHRDKYLWKENPQVRVIKVPIKHVKATDFGLSKGEKESLIRFGYAAMMIKLKTEGF